MPCLPSARGLLYQDNLDVRQRTVYHRRRLWNGRTYRQGRSCHRERGHRNWYHEGGAPRTTWTSDELNTIGTAEELDLAPLRRNGTLRTPVTMWVVRLGDDLYVRSYRGHGGSWFRAAQVRHEGRIRAGGVEKDVTFVEKTDPGINDQIDVAYGAKCRRYGARFVNPMVAPEARAATIQLVPRSTSSSFNNHKGELGLRKHLPLFLLLALLFGSAVVVMAQTEHIPPFTGTCLRYSSPSSLMREKGAQNWHTGSSGLGHRMMHDPLSRSAGHMRSPQQATNARQRTAATKSTHAGSWRML